MAGFRRPQLCVRFHERRSAFCCFPLRCPEQRAPESSPESAKPEFRLRTALKIKTPSGRSMEALSKPLPQFLAPVTFSVPYFQANPSGCAVCARSAAGQTQPAQTCCRGNRSVKSPEVWGNHKFPEPPLLRNIGQRVAPGACPQVVARWSLRSNQNIRLPQIRISTAKWRYRYAGFAAVHRHSKKHNPAVHLTPGRRR